MYKIKFIHKLTFNHKSTQAFLLTLLGMLALSSLLLTAYFSFSHYQHELDLVERTALQMAEAISKHQNRMIQDSELLLRQVANHPDFNLHDIEKCNKYAAELRIILPEHANIALANLEGEVLCSVVPLQGLVNIKDRAYFKRAKETGQFEGGEYQIGRITGRAAANYGLQLQDATDMTRPPIGVAYIAIDVLKLNQILIDSLPLDGATLTLLSNDGTVIARYPDPEDFTGEKVPDSDLVKKVFSHQLSGTFDVKGLDGVQRIYAVSPVRGTGDGRWSMVVGVPVENATAQFRDIILKQIIILAVVFGGLLLIVALATAQFSRRLRKVTEVAEKIRQGDYTARSGLPAKADEIGILASAFDHMAEELGHRDSEQKQSVGTIKKMNAELEMRVEERTHELNNAAGQLEILNTALTKSLQERETQTSQLKKLAQLSDMLQACLKLEEAYDLIARYCELLGNSPGGAIYIMSSSPNLAERVATWGNGGDLAQECSPDDCWAMRRGALYRTGAGHAQLVCAHAEHVLAEETVCLPILAQGEMVGFIYVYLDESIIRDEVISKSMEELLVAVAEQGGQTIAALNMREELRRQSIRDPLTGLYNRRYMEETLIREQTRSKRHGSPISVISFDIDHFKNVNDTYGHDAGDCALKMVANVLRSNVRVEDIVCRMGGEEIIIVLPGADIQQAWEKAEGLRKMIQSQPLTYEGMELPALTVSGGVASYPGDGESWKIVLKVADHRLYQAKKAGRNQTHISTSNIVE